MTTSEQLHVDEVSPSYWRVTFANGPVNLVDPNTVDELAALVDRIEVARAPECSGFVRNDQGMP
jgi:hypothetical protein